MEIPCGLRSTLMAMGSVREIFFGGQNHEAGHWGCCHPTFTESAKTLIVKRLIGKGGDWVKRRSGGLARSQGQDRWKVTIKIGVWTANWAVPNTLMEGRASHIIWPPSRWSRLDRDSESVDRLFVMSQNNGDFPRRSRDDWW